MSALRGWQVLVPGTADDVSRQLLVRQNEGHRDEVRIGGGLPLEAVHVDHHADDQVVRREGAALDDVLQPVSRKSVAGNCVSSGDTHESRMSHKKYCARARLALELFDDRAPDFRPRHRRHDDAREGFGRGVAH